MGFDPTVRTEAFGGTDKSWIRNRKGLATMVNGMLDMSLFTSNHLINGRIPSGTLLAKILTTTGGGTVGFYGPYGGSSSPSPVNEVQQVKIDATGGTFTLTFRGGTTSAIAFNATPAVFQAALEALAEINVGDVTVAGGPGNAGGTTPYTVTFKGQYAGQDVAAMTGSGASLTGGAATVTITTPTAGVPTDNGLDIPFGFLFEDVAAGHYPDVPNTDPSTHADVAVAILWEGTVIASKLPNFAATTGKLDAAAQAALTRFLFV